MTTDWFHPVVAGWFARRFREPTEAQRLSWPRIVDGGNTLLAAPTGSGKTLAAFLVCIDRLVRQALEGTLSDQTQVVYVSPLKALSNDIHRNLEVPLQEIRAAAAEAGYDPSALGGIRAVVRTGDTPPAERQRMLRKPPHILVTTPESLYLLLTGAKSREMLRGVRTVIVDEIHALARDKRGSHLALSLARLDRLVCGTGILPVGPTPVVEDSTCNTDDLKARNKPVPHITGRMPLPRPVRIGLSATQRPIDEIARFLVGTANLGPDGEPHCHIVDTGHVRELDLAVEVPPSELSAVCSMEQWQEVYARLSELIRSHRSTLIFVNTRRMAERVCHYLEEQLGEGQVASHHGSLSREIRLRAEERLKAGELKAIVATASLELGIDIGFIDLVCQIGSPRSIATFLQRVGRSGHALGLIPKGRIFALTRDELLEALALIRAVRLGRLDRVELPVAPLDILAQQIVAAVACEEWDEDELFAMCRRAWSYRDLKREDFDAVIAMLSEGIAPGNRTGAYLHRDRIHHMLRARRGARIAAITSGGAIPETADYRVMTEGERTFVGTLNEDFAIESMSGDVFLLGNSSWRILYVRGGEVTVVDAQGAPATIPFWLGEAPGRTVELSQELSQFREELWMIAANPNPARECGAGPGTGVPGSDAIGWLQAECGADGWAARQAVEYVVAQAAAIGLIPTQKRVVFERFFDESGGMQLVIHAPFGARINRAWGLALRKCFCRTFDFELQASADDNGIVLSIGPQHSFPIERMFDILSPRHAEALLVQALLAVPMFLIRWRWNVTRALAVLRQHGGQKVPPPLQRFRADDLLTAVFPMQTACFEHRTGDLEVPDHPLVRQTVHDCLHEAMDLPGWMKLLEEIEAGRVELIGRDTREPSPFSYQLLNANPYAFLDDAPLEERRARAVATRRTIRVEDVRDLGRLDPEAIAQVRSEAWPIVRDAEELHDTLLTLGALPAAEGSGWRGYFEELVSQGRATNVLSTQRVCEKDFPSRARKEAGRRGPLPHGRGSDSSTASHTPSQSLWIAAEQWPMVYAAFPEAEASPPISLPEALIRERQVDAEQANLMLVRGRLDVSGPTRAERIAADLGMNVDDVRASLERLESEGFVLRGQFSGDSEGTEWCERRLLARIHRLTLDGLRRQVQPVTPEVLLRFLLGHQLVLHDCELRIANCPATPNGSAVASELKSEIRNSQSEIGDGRGALARVIGMLQGFELPAGAWERDVLPARLQGYEPHWLDELFHRGECVWGRLQPPRKNAEDSTGGHILTRVVPISLVSRADLGWLLPPERGEPWNSARGNSQAVYEALRNHGALFFDDLMAATALLPAQLEDALGELAALGIVTADGFGAIRSLVAKRKHMGRRHTARLRRQSRGRAYSHGGRWSRFPPFVQPVAHEQRVERWAWQLLNRYGVMFRDLLARESVAPAWHELRPVYRRLEARGEIRGGRFVAGVAGEQFAMSDVVDRLRRTRDEPPGDVWQVLSAADPCNLVGIITDGPRVPATRGNRVLFVDGRPIASRETREIRWLREVDEAARQRAERMLRWPDARYREPFPERLVGNESIPGRT